MVAVTPIKVYHVHPIFVRNITNIITTIPVVNPIIDSFCFVFLEIKPSKNVPSNPPYVNEAMLNAISTTAFELSLNIIAENINKIAQMIVSIRDIRKLLLSS